MFKKIFSLSLCLLSLSIGSALSAKNYANNFERWTSVQHLKNSELYARFNRAVIGDCPEVGYEMPLEERKQIIKKIHEEIKNRESISQFFLKEICKRKISCDKIQLCVDYLEPEVAQLLIDLGYSTHDVISSTLKELKDNEISPNAIGIFKTILKKSPLNLQEEQDLFEHLKDKHKVALSLLLKEIK